VGIHWSPAALLIFRLSESLKLSKHADGVFAVIAEGGAEFVEDEDFIASGGIAVTEEDGFDVFFF
jgi:hypothetical protein